MSLYLLHLLYILRMFLYIYYIFYISWESVSLFTTSIIYPENVSLYLLHLLYILRMCLYIYYLYYKACRMSCSFICQVFFICHSFCIFMTVYIFSLSYNNRSKIIIIKASTETGSNLAMILTSDGDPLISRKRVPIHISGGLESIIFFIKHFCPYER